MADQEESMGAKQRDRAAILSSRDFLKAILDAQRDTVFVLDLTTGLPVQWNRAFEETSGYSSEEISTLKAPDSYYSPEDLVRASEVISNMVAEGTQLVQLSLICKDGRRVPTEYSVSILEGEDGSAQYLVSIGRDITDRASADQELKAALETVSREKELIHTMVNSLPGIFYVLDFEGFFYLWNASFERASGRSGKELTEINARDLFEGDDRRIITDGIREVAETGEATVEARLLHRDGRKTPYRFSGRKVEIEGETRLVGMGLDSTAEHIAKLELAAERDRAQQYLDVAGVMLVALDVEGRITLINEKGRKILGYDRSEELVGRNWFELVLPEEDGPRVKDVFAQITRGDLDALEYYENAVRTRDGRERTIAWHNALLRDTDGEVIGTLSSGEDITDRMLVEVELMSSKAFLESVIQASPGLIYIYDLGEHRNVFASEEITDLLGYSPEDIQEMGDQFFATVMHAEDLPKVLEHHLQLEGAEDGEVRALEYRMRNRDGGWRWFRSVDTPFLRSDSGGVTQIVGICEDYTARREAFEGLRRFEEVVSNSSDLLALLDRDYRYLIANKAYHSAFRKEPGELVGKTANEVFGREFFETVIKPHADRCLTGEDVRYEGWFELPSQGQRFLGVSYSPYRVFRSDEVMGFVVGARDLTDLKHSTDELNDLNRELEQRVSERTAQLAASMQELEAFSYSVSHDLRAPLRAIDGFSRALKEDCADQLDPQGVGYIERVRAGTKRMGELIDDLLTLSRAAKGEIRIEEVDLSEMAAGILRGICDRDPTRDVDSVVPPGLRVQADPRLMRTVLQNLLENAWKFTSHHDRARIEVGMEVEEGKEWFFVRDDGAGFDMQYSDKLFGAFERLHPIEEFPGSGIGLATVKRVIQRHGGSVRATGGVEEGATFYLHLPGRIESGEE